MKPLGIPLAACAWSAALVAAFLAGWGIASRSAEPNASLQEGYSSHQARPSSKSSRDEAALRQESRPGAHLTGDPAADVVTIAKLEDPVQRTRRLLALIDRLGPGDFEAVLTAFRELGITPERRAEYDLLLAAWGRVDPLAALAFLQKNSGSPADRQTVLAAWALDNPDAATEWALENFDTESDGGNAWLVGVIKELAANDLERATGLLNRLPQDLAQKDTREALNNTLHTIISTHSEEEIDATMAWVGGLPDAGLRAGAARRVAMRLAASDPQKVVQWAGTLDPESRRQAYEELIQPWALRAPEEALAWAATLEGEDLHQVAERVTPAAAAKDLQGASQWLSRFDGDPGMDTARRRLANQVTRNNPELAADWIGKITDVAMGEREFHRMLEGWMERDPEGALRYMENNNPPESVRQRAMRILGEQEASPE